MKNVKIIAILVLVTVAGACTAPFNPGGSGIEDLLGNLGGLRISRITGTTVTGESVFSAQTALPVLDYDDLGALRFTLTDGPVGADDRTVVLPDPAFDAEGDLETPVEIRDLVPGEWTLTVEGLTEESGVVLVRGTSNVTVAAGEFEDIGIVSVQLVDDAGDGNWELTITWPPESDPDYAITDVVTQIRYRVGEGGSWQTVNQPNSGWETENDVYTHVLSGADTPGTYLVSVELVAGENAAPYSVVARYDEIWRVYSNLTTRKTVDFDTADFAYGGGARFGINIELPEDLPAFFAEAPASSVVAGNTYEIEAAEIAGASYQWRINLENVDGPEGSDPSLTITTHPGDAGQVFLVVLVITVDGRQYSGEHRVRVLAP